jgi:hypothetical protein
MTVIWREDFREVRCEEFCFIFVTSSPSFWMACCLIFKGGTEAVGFWLTSLFSKWDYRSD